MTNIVPFFFTRISQQADLGIMKGFAEASKQELAQKKRRKKIQARKLNIYLYVDT